jgi:RND family efflux transporter MFP subunit
VQAGQPVAVLNAGGGLEIALGLPESVIAQVTPGMATTIRFTAVPGRTFEGRVTEVSPSVDASTATYPVRMTVDDPSAELRPGMAASVTFDFTRASGAEDVLVVPAKAVGEDDQGRFVFLVEPAEGDEATARKHPVTIGRLTAEGFEIIEGLTAGQLVATAGLQTLLDGQRVRLR